MVLVELVKIKIDAKVIISEKELILF
ncbi:uncharacterized protein METZ01_LOCUS302388 [marine metagenome]|uniref:Uncharacterized protein n=1 Tax=marine metagenome TaxID=408172 RepID=A0A382MKN0_9ZZZZ